MLDNLEERGCQLLGIKACPDEKAQIERLKAIGNFKYQSCISLNKIYESHLSPD